MSQENLTYPYEPEFSFKKMLTDRLKDVLYILQFKKLIIIALLVGAAAGAFYAWWSPSTYTARLTLVVDDSKSSSGAGGLSALAGSLGVSMGGLGGSNDMLSGDNIQELVKSHRLIRATLLSLYDSTQTLADKYAQVYKLNKRWLKYSLDGNITRFPADDRHNTRLQDSLLNELVLLVIEGDFGIAKPDKKLNFFEVRVTMRDEKLAQLFCTRIIKQSTDFYISTKTQKLRGNVERLQRRGDSIGRILNYRTYASAAANQNLIDINPAFTNPGANIELKERDKAMLSTVYTEIVRNLEGSKTMLAQETPTVQIVDKPELPLKRIYVKYKIAIPAGMILSVIALSIIERKKRFKI
jgi:hypothetical protein